MTEEANVRRLVRLAEVFGGAVTFSELEQTTLTRLDVIHDEADQYIAARKANLE